jgi:phosphoribosylformimino-5-aminoimidazole carboxamide ribotide isomerase
VSFALFPAIDLRGGRVVRLHQGDYAAETVYGDDPVAQALAFAEAGAAWVHVVDLDAARTGEPTNRTAITAVAAALAGRGVALQTGGGIRTRDDAAALAAAGVARVVLGTAAVEDPALVTAVAPLVAVAVGLDVRGRDVAVRGWTEPAGPIDDVLARFADGGAAAVVATQISVDGTGEGPDLDLYRHLLATTALAVVASGGVGTTAHIEALAALEVGGRRLGGVIVGRALYERAFTVEEALACVPPG